MYVSIIILMAHPSTFNPAGTMLKNKLLLHDGFAVDGRNFTRKEIRDIVGNTKTLIKYAGITPIINLNHEGLFGSDKGLSGYVTNIRTGGFTGADGVKRLGIYGDVFLYKSVAEQYNQGLFPFGSPELGREGTLPSGAKVGMWLAGYSVMSIRPAYGQTFSSIKESDLYGLMYDLIPNNVPGRECYSITHNEKKIQGYTVFNEDAAKTTNFQAEGAKMPTAEDLTKVADELAILMEKMRGWAEAMNEKEDGEGGGNGDSGNGEGGTENAADKNKTEDGKGDEKMSAMIKGLGDSIAALNQRFDNFQQGGGNGDSGKQYTAEELAAMFETSKAKQATNLETFSGMVKTMGLKKVNEIFGGRGDGEIKDPKVKGPGSGEPSSLSTEEQNSLKASFDQYKALGTYSDEDCAMLAAKSQTNVVEFNAAKKLLIPSAQAS